MWRIGIVVVAGCSFDPNPAASSTDGPATDATPLVDTAVDAPPSAITASFGERSDADHKNVTRDTYVDAMFPVILHGQFTDALLDGTPASIMLLRFDLAALAGGVTVVGGALHIHTNGVQNNPAIAIVEVTSAWNDNELWPGPTRGGTSFGGPPAVDQDTEYIVPLPAALIQRWVTTPASNNGIALTTNTTNDVFIRTSESGTSSARPLLSVTFVP